MDWAFLGFVVAVGSFLVAMLFATFYDWPRKHDSHESIGELKSEK